jgi:hypothetical protein
LAFLQATADGKLDEFAYKFLFWVGKFPEEGGDSSHQTEEVYI